MTTAPSTPELPNNFGATLLIVAGLLSAPALIGIPLLLYGLSQLRARDGRRTYAFLLPWAHPRV